MPNIIFDTTHCKHLQDVKVLLVTSVPPPPMKMRSQTATGNCNCSAYSAPDHVLGSSQNTAEYSQNVKSCQVAGLDGEGTILATIAFDSSFGCPRLPETHPEFQAVSVNP